MATKPWMHTCVSPLSRNHERQVCNANRAPGGVLQVVIIGEELRAALCIPSDDEDEEESREEPPFEKRPRQPSVGASSSQEDSLALI